MTVRSSIRPSTPQGHQYTSYTGYNPVLNPVFLAQNRVLTHVVAKQAKTTKVKHKFVNGKKKFKSILSCLFGGRRKKLGDKLGENFKIICLLGSVANSVGTPLEFAAFRSGFDAKYSRASAFWFFLSTTTVFTAFRTHFARKNTSIFKLIGSLSRRKSKY